MKINVKFVKRYVIYCVNILIGVFLIDFLYLINIVFYISLIEMNPEKVWFAPN